VGSNDWVVPVEERPAGAASRTTRISASRMPSVWFMNGLHCRNVSADCPFDVSGVSFPGVPGSSSATTPGSRGARRTPTRTSRTCSSRPPTRTSPTTTSSPASRIPFATRTETIKVASGADVELDVRETRHGPILNDVDEAPRARAAPCAALDRDGRGRSHVRGVLHLMTAATFDDFQAAFAAYGRRPRTSSTPTSWPHRLCPARQDPDSRDGADRGADLVRALTVPTNGRATSRGISFPPVRPAGRRHRHRQQRRR
jgi:hypothetical protein